MQTVKKKRTINKTAELKKNKLISKQFVNGFIYFRTLDFFLLFSSFFTLISTSIIFHFLKSAYALNGPGWAINVD